MQPSYRVVTTTASEINGPLILHVSVQNLVASHRFHKNLV